MLTELDRAATEALDPCLADDNVIGSVAEGVLHEVADGDGSCLESARLKPDAVRGVDAQLERVLDRDDPLVGGDEFNERVEECRLAAAGAAAHQVGRPPAGLFFGRMHRPTTRGRL